MRFRIAVAQLEIAQHEPGINLRKADAFARRAAAAKADVIIFPEDFVTGPIEDRPDLVDRDGTYRRVFQRMARMHGIDIVPGTIIEGANGKRFNTTYYIDSKGKIRARYRKSHLWDVEKKAFIPGKQAAVFDTGLGRTGLIICWDLAFPEIFQRMMRRDVEVVLCPAYWEYEAALGGLKYDRNSEVKFVNALCVGRAFENEIVLIFCNAAGKTHKKHYDNNLVGRSQIAAPFKGVLRRLNHNREELIIKTVDTSILKEAERVYRIRRDSR